MSRQIWVVSAMESVSTLYVINNCKIIAVHLMDRCWKGLLLTNRSRTVPLCMSSGHRAKIQ